MGKLGQGLHSQNQKTERHAVSFTDVMKQKQAEYEKSEISKVIFMILINILLFLLLLLYSLFPFRCEFFVCVFYCADVQWLKVLKHKIN
jgi:hypothetical protein